MFVNNYIHFGRIVLKQFVQRHSDNICLHQSFCKAFASYSTKHTTCGTQPSTCARVADRQMPRARPSAMCVGLDVRSLSILRGTRSIPGYVKVNDVNLHYVKVEGGDHVILLMPGALGTTTTDFGPQLNGGFDPETFTVIGWDPRGYGKSRPPDRDFPLDFFHRDANDANELMKALGHDTFSVLGWSDGGIAAMILASEYPESMRKLVVWGANSFVCQDDIDIYEQIKNISDWSERMKQPMTQMYGEEYFQQIWLSWIAGIENIWTEKKGDICTDALDRIRCPTLLLHGEKDPMVPRIHPGFLQQKIMGSRLINFSDGKHNIHLRYAKEFNRHVDIFLRK